MADGSGSAAIALCMAGMRAEAAGDHAAARECYEQAWTASADALDACAAAHYLARQAADPAEALRWNQQALRSADAADVEQVAAFYPSLHLNLGWSWEQLGDQAAALSCYRRAAASLAALPPQSRDQGLEASLREKLARLEAAPER
ncbi:MAG TPA: hypothetical protein VGE07_30970 [Herpetosiphonaceae bacterium]